MGAFIDKLFGRSPFRPLVEHSNRVQSCVDALPDVIDAFLAQDAAKMDSLHTEVSRREMEADKIKNAIREQLPRRMMLPVEIRDLQKFLSEQDAVADTVEDISAIVTLRPVTIEPGWAVHFREYTTAILAVARSLGKCTGELGNLVEASFGGEEGELVVRLVQETARLEHEADVIGLKIARATYAIEPQVGPVGVMFLHGLLKTFGHLGNHAEDCADRLRLMVTRR